MQILPVPLCIHFLGEDPFEFKRNFLGAEGAIPKPKGQFVLLLKAYSDTKAPATHKSLQIFKTYYGICLTMA